MKIFVVGIVASVALFFGYQVVADAGPAQANVLFIGNSYTMYNELPSVVADITKNNGYKIETTLIASGGRKLHEHASDPIAMGEVMSGNYDVVIIQEQSMMPASEFLESSTIPSAQKIADAARQAGARVVFFQTWAHQNGNATIGRSSYTSMRDALVSGYSQMASKAGGEIAPAGLAWDRARSSADLSSVNLYASDGVHPSPEGTYVAAAAIAGTIMQRQIESSPGGGVSGDDATALTNAANSVLQYR